MRRLKALAIFNALSFIAQMVVAAMTQSVTYTETGPWEIALQYQTLLHPSSIILGIWVILYTSLMVHCLYHIIMTYKHDATNAANGELSRMGILFILLNLAQAGWFITWTRGQLMIAMLLTFFQLICLILIHLRLGIYRATKTAGIKVATQFPLSIYLGWISMAAILNTTIYLHSIGWDGFGVTQYQWTLVMVLFSIFLSVWMILVRRNIYIGLIVAWFLFAFIQNWEAVNSNNFDAATTAAWAGIGIVFTLSIIQIVRNLTHRRKRALFPVAPAPLK